MNLAIKCVMAAFLLMSSGCGIARQWSLQEECRPLVKTFFRMPLRERLTEFGTHDLESQYKIFICGNHVVHPPAIYLAGPFAQGGSATAAFLKTKLAHAKDDLTVRDIILVLTEMSRRNTYDVAGDKDLVRLMTASVENMRDKDWKRMTQENLSEIVKR